MRKNLKKVKRRSLKNLIISFFLGVFALFVIALLISTNWKIYQKKAGLKAKVAELQKETAILEKRNLDLSRDLSYIESEEYLERVAREQLDLKKSGEDVIVIQKQDNLEKNNIEESESWWERLKSIFKK